MELVMVVVRGVVKTKNKNGLNRLFAWAAVKKKQTKQKESTLKPPRARLRTMSACVQQQPRQGLMAAAPARALRGRTMPLLLLGILGTTTLVSPVHASSTPDCA